MTAIGTQRIPIVGGPDDGDGKEIESRFAVEGKRFDDYTILRAPYRTSWVQEDRPLRWIAVHDRAVKLYLEPK